MDADKILGLIEKEVINFKTPLVEMVNLTTGDPFKVLVATMLSARTKDETTYNVCKKLFAKVRNPDDLRSISLNELEMLLYPVGFYRNKAKLLKKLPNYLKHGVPDNLDELLKIPGVGRKTANIVLNAVYGKHSIGVDTHVHRISNRIGLVRTKSPRETEEALKKLLPKKWQKKINYLFVSFGQNICKPISPLCSKCIINDCCKKIGVGRHR